MNVDQKISANTLIVACDGKRTFYITAIVTVKGRFKKTN